jgi:hypothetical protein
MVNNMKRRKQKANTSKPASSAPLNAPAQALSGDETKRPCRGPKMRQLFSVEREDSRWGDLR